MADMDWGWKRKRSMAPATLVDVDYDENDEELPSVDKKSISSLHGKRSQENDVNGELINSMTHQKHAHNCEQRGREPKMRQKNT